jgi:hypothetical protein
MEKDARITVPWAQGSQKQKRHHRHHLEAPVIPGTPPSTLTNPAGTPRALPLSKQRRIAWYIWFTWVWIGALTIGFGFLLFAPLPSSPVPPLLVKKGNPHHVKVYPFNLYESTVGVTVRYPREGGIPQLDWGSVKHFEACCRDDTSLHCFTASELALRRDPRRTAKALPDVYMEIQTTAGSAPAWNQVGSRCQLIWSTEKGDVES